MSRTIVIGDLHGCYDETVELLSVLQATSSDRVIFAGDLASYPVHDEVMAFS